MTIERFDAYYKWLGIPPSEQPPNHYRLLGINLYEADSDVIATAADRQMVHVRARRLGQHSADCERLLNELAAARRVLLNPSEKAKYDDGLRTQFAQTKPDILPPPPVVFDQIPPRERAAIFGTAKLAAAVCVVVLVIVVLVFVFARPSEPPTAALPTSPVNPVETAHEPPQRHETLPEQPEAAAESSVPAQPPVAVEPDVGSMPPVVESPPAEVPSEVTDTKVAPGDPVEPTERSLADLVVPADKPLPSLADEQISTAVGQVKDAFRAELERQRTPEESSALAESLINSALPADVPVERRYAMLVTAAEVATAAGAVDSLNKAFTQLEVTANRDQIAAKAEAFVTISKQISKPEQHAGIIGYLEDVIDECVRKDRFDLAVRVAEATLQNARRSRDTNADHRIAARLKQVKQWATRFEPVAQALLRLESAPDDAEANAVVGQYLCLVKADWEQGLPLLAKGSQSALRDAASAETSSGSADPARLADVWLNIAAEQSDVSKMNALMRSEHWLRRAILDADASQRVVLERRLQSVEQDIGKVATLPAGAVLLMPFEPATIDNHDGQLMVNDGSLHGYRGVARGTQIVSGIAGNALAFARPDSVEIDGLAWLPQSKAGFAISVWVWANSLQGSKKRHDYILSNDLVNPKKASGYVLRLSLEGRPDFTCRAQKWREVVLDQPITLQEWHHLAVTRDVDRVSLYWNGQPHGRITLMGELVASDKPLRLGNSGHPDGRNFQGMIDELAFFPRALSADEVRLLYLRGLVGRPLLEKE